jgi:hypothetical protein
MRRPDDFSANVIETLAKRVNYMCSNPECEQPTSGPQVDPTKSLSVGEAAHITAASPGPGAKRYDASLTHEERRSIENGIWLCRKCGRLVDTDEGRYPAPLLREWKRGAEKRALQDVQSGPRRTTIIHHHGAASEPVSAFSREIAARHLADEKDPEFCHTLYHVRMGEADPTGKVRPLQTTATLFAQAPDAVLARIGDKGFQQWMNVNERRYDPWKRDCFIPGPAPEQMAGRYLWHDADLWMIAPGARCCRNYLAMEKSGFVEYGFEPAGPEDPPKVYYARIVARLVGFLNFLTELGQKLGFDATDVSVGLAMRGIKGKVLSCVTLRLMRQGMQMTPPEKDTFLHLWPVEKSPWEINALTKEFAEALLDAWSFWRSPWMDTPEFENGVYTGEYFVERFRSW